MSGPPARPGDVLFAAFTIGLTIGAATTAATALLLYTGQGFLRAAGLLIASTLLAVAAGLWAGAPDAASAPSSAMRARRGRWIIASIALLLGAAFAALWNARPALREAPTGGALAVLLLLAFPAYSASAVLASLETRGERSAGTLATSAMAGAAIGVLLATTTLIPSLDAWSIYIGAAALLMFASLPDRTARTLVRADDVDMTDRVVLVTGVGARGQLAFTVAQRFLAAHASVVISGRSSALDDAAAELPGAVAIRADLTNNNDIASLIEGTRDRFGRLDALINVAGGLTVIDTVENTTPQQWQAEIERNAGTALRMSRAALPLLRASRGAIVNFASPAAADAPARLAAYSAGKAGVVALTQALAREERENGVRVNAIAPDMMDTDQNRQSAGLGTRFVQRTAVAELTLALAAPDATTSGAVIHMAPDAEPVAMSGPLED